MSIHMQHKVKRSDDEFIKGDLSLLVPNNSCRLLDGRRTPGYIESYCSKSAMFVWRITDFEDKGSSWELPAEKVTSFQFEKDSKKLSEDQVREIVDSVEIYNTENTITPKTKDKIDTEKKVEKAKLHAKAWLNENSVFIKNGSCLDLKDRKGPSSLANDLLNYMESLELRELEEETAKALVLNPNSGEWIKGMLMVFAELGLVGYKGKIPRTDDIFTGLGVKRLRKKYIIHRLGFVRAYLSLLGFKELTVYRGMCTDSSWENIERSLLSCTINTEVGQSFGNFLKEDKYKNAYLARLTFPAEKIFMTYLETAAMNEQYLEAEALVLNDTKLWL